MPLMLWQDFSVKCFMICIVGGFFDAEMQPAINQIICNFMMRNKTEDLRLETGERIARVIKMFHCPNTLKWRNVSASAGRSYLHMDSELGSEWPGLHIELVERFPVAVLLYFNKFSSEVFTVSSSFYFSPVLQQSSQKTLHGLFFSSMCTILRELHHLFPISGVVTVNTQSLCHWINEGFGILLVDTCTR